MKPENSIETTDNNIGDTTEETNEGAAVGTTEETNEDATETTEESTTDSEPPEPATEAAEATATESAPEANAQPEAQSEPQPEPEPHRWTGKTYQNVRVMLTEAEALKHGRNQSRLLQQIERLKEDLKQVKAQYKAKEEKLLAEVKIETQAINNNYIFKDVECEVRFNDPTNGQKSIVRNDTGELVTIEMMEPHEMRRPVTQHQLFDAAEIAAPDEEPSEAPDEVSDAPETSDTPDEADEGDESEGTQEGKPEDTTANIFPVNGVSPNGTSQNGASPNGYQFEEDLPPAPPMPKMTDQISVNGSSTSAANGASATPEEAPKKRTRAKAETT